MHVALEPSLPRSFRSTRWFAATSPASRYFKLLDVSRAPTPERKRQDAAKEKAPSRTEIGEVMPSQAAGWPEMAGLDPPESVDTSRKLPVLVLIRCGQSVVDVVIALANDWGRDALE